jgi:hypothetical protein
MPKKEGIVDEMRLFRRKENSSVEILVLILTEEIM